jgi:hypothetical protein
VVRGRGRGRVEARATARATVEVQQRAKGVAAAKVAGARIQEAEGTMGTGGVKVSRGGVVKMEEG